MAQKISIGVLANRGTDACLKAWQPTATYLSETIPKYQFEIRPLLFEQINACVAQDQVEFIITNPGIYVEFESLYGINGYQRKAGRIHTDRSVYQSQTLPFDRLRANGFSAFGLSLSKPISDATCPGLS